MAPRSSKTKKATEVNEAPKKGRGKAKNVTESELDLEDQAVDLKPVVEKKKRGKKGASENKDLEQNGQIEDTAPPSKKGRKKIIEEPIHEEKQDSNAEQSGEDEDSSPSTEHENENEETNGDSKELKTTGRGNKKQGKKEPAAGKPKSEPRSGRGRKAKPEIEEDVSEEIEEKPKPAIKSRGRKAQLKQVDADINNVEEEAKPEPAARGRKKAPPKKEKTPESEKELEDDENDVEEEKPKQSKKKETKGRKNQGKKVQAKEESDENDAPEEPPAAKKRKVNKKEEKEEDIIEEEQPETKAKGRRGQKKAVETVDEALESGDATTKRRRKPVDDKAPVEKKGSAKNKALTNYEELDFSNNAKNTQGKNWNFKIASWNVDGIRAWMGKGGLDYLTYEKPDILCLQETKCSSDKLPDDLANLPGYHAYWQGSDKDGYAGVGIYTAQLAMHVQYGLHHEELDAEGRIITAEYEQFYLICTYVPNAGRKLVTLPKRLQWNEEFRKYVKELDKKKPVIICGDMNVSHQEIDLANPKTNKKNAGFTEEERAGMSDLLGDGFIDTFRHLYPDKTGAYTFWTYMMNSRAKNVGWRLDYFIVSERFLPALCDNVIRDQVYGSDHCPIALFLHLNGADKPKE